MKQKGACEGTFYVFMQPGVPLESIPGNSFLNCGSLFLCAPGIGSQTGKNDPSFPGKLFKLSLPLCVIDSMNI